MCKTSDDLMVTKPLVCSDKMKSHVSSQVVKRCREESICCDMMDDRRPD